MSVSLADIQQSLRALSDASLLHKYQHNQLSTSADPYAHLELMARGLEIPPKLPPQDASEPPPDAQDLGPLALLMRAFTPTEAHILQARLQAEGIFACVADGQLLQTNPLWSVALGWVRILVAQQHLEAAQAVCKSLAQGDFALDSEWDTTVMCPSCEHTFQTANQARFQCTHCGHEWSSNNL